MIRITGIEQAINKVKQYTQAQIELEKTKQITSLIQELKNATPVDSGNARDNWKRDGDAIVNEVDYISHLNEGTSQQAPAFFVEKTVLAHKGVSPSGMIVKNI
jgi:hypothetical protein